MSAVAERLYRRRRVINAFNLIVSGFCAIFGLFWLVWILWTTLHHGIAAMKPGLFTQMTPPPGADGGIANALFGSLVMSLMAIRSARRSASPPVPISPSSPRRGRSAR